MSESTGPRAGLAEVSLPVSDLNAALPHLRRPFTPEAIKFKVQTVFKENKGCIVVAYIDARLVIEHFNAVCGGSWVARPRRVEDKPNLLWCELEVFGVTRLDLGDSSKGMSKDLWSDALKRAAVQWGVGVSVYALPQLKLYTDTTGRLEVRKGTLMLTEHGHTKLREGYATWLQQHGADRFGPPLDHGDVEGATVDEDVESEQAFEPAAPPELHDDVADGLKAHAREVYLEIAASEQGRRELPPARFDAWLRQSWHSVDSLKQLVEHLEQRRDALAEAGA